MIGPRRFDAALDVSVDAFAVVSRDLVFLQLFSGHRRQGDVQFHVESSSFVGRFNVFVISMDLAVSKN